MAVRNFDGTDDEVRFPITSVTALSCALLIKRGATGAVYHNLMEGASSSTGQWALEFQSGAFGGAQNRLSFFIPPGTEVNSGTTITVADTTTYYIVGFSRASGTTTGRFHRYSFGTSTWTHAAASGTTGNPASQSGGTIRLGEFDDIDDANIKIAVAAYWAADIGDSGFNALTTNLDTDDWINHATAPVSVWEPGQQSSPILDRKGTADSTTINGTTVVTGDDPPGWTFFGAGGGAVTPKKLASLGVG